MVSATFLEELQGRYGRKQGVLRHLAALAAAGLGRWRELEAVDFSRVSRLVFVCHGNICRSAYAAARARARGLEAVSFGLEAHPGTPADRIAIATARKRGIDLEHHRASTRDEHRLGPGDLLVAMEPGQAAALLDDARPVDAQVTLLGLWSPELRPHLEDPFGLSEAYFETCFGCIDGAVDVLATALPRSLQ